MRPLLRPTLRTPPPGPPGCRRTVVTEGDTGAPVDPTSPREGGGTRGSRRTRNFRVLTGSGLERRHDKHSSRDTVGSCGQVCTGLCHLSHPGRTSCVRPRRARSPYRDLQSSVGATVTVASQPASSQSRTSVPGLGERDLEPRTEIDPGGTLINSTSVSPDDSGFRLLTQEFSPGLCTPPGHGCTDSKTFHLGGPSNLTPTPVRVEVCDSDLTSHTLQSRE